jgi:hypothetical protein
MNDEAILEGLKAVEERDLRLSTFLERNRDELTKLWRTTGPKQWGNMRQWDERAADLAKRGFKQISGNGLRVAWRRLQERVRAEDVKQARTAQVGATPARAGFSVMGGVR